MQVLFNKHFTISKCHWSKNKMTLSVILRFYEFFVIELSRWRDIIVADAQLRLFGMLVRGWKFSSEPLVVCCSCGPPLLLDSWPPLADSSCPLDSGTTRPLVIPRLADSGSSKLFLKHRFRKVIIGLFFIIKLKNLPNKWHNSMLKVHPEIMVLLNVKNNSLRKCHCQIIIN